MAYHSISYRGDVPYIAANAIANLADDFPRRDPEILRVYDEQDPAYGAVMSRAFEFLRTHARSNYSNTSFMQVLDGPNRPEGTPKPLLFTAEVPFNYDPDTEVKTGGLLGVLVQLNDGQSRALCSVAEPHRRQGVASALLYLHREAAGAPAFWVGRQNVTAQTFLLRNGYFVEQMNSRGALRFTQTATEDQE